MTTEFIANTVLVVDDAPDSLSLINDTLEKQGINTLVALGGKQAITIAKKICPNMILLDAIMPDMDGFETCKQLKQDPALASIPVIFMTGLTDKDSVLKGFEAGGVDYLTKPVNPNELLARMKVHLRNANLTSSAQQALDLIGQNIFAIKNNGQIVWATPQTEGLFAKAQVSDDWKRTTMPNILQEWIRHQPNSGQVLKLEDYPLEVCFIEYRSEVEILLKLTDGVKISGEEKLREELNLTVRESEVLYWLANGKTNKQIAQILTIGVRTVNKHLEQIFPKLGVENRTSAAGIAIRILN